LISAPTVAVIVVDLSKHDRMHMREDEEEKAMARLRCVGPVEE
jgi:hypothetical protein